MASATTAIQPSQQNRKKLIVFIVQKNRTMCKFSMKENGPFHTVQEAKIHIGVSPHVIF